MLSVDRIKKLLNDPNISDEEAEKIRDEFYSLSEIIFEKWMAERTKMKEHNKSMHQCPECKLHYRDKEWADKCEAWCREHKSCNIEITAHAEESKKS